MNTFLTRW